LFFVVILSAAQNLCICRCSFYAPIFLRRHLVLAIIFQSRHPERSEGSPHFAVAVAAALHLLFLLSIPEGDLLLQLPLRFLLDHHPKPSS
jgi:hypothetical protein